MNHKSNGKARDLLQHAIRTAGFPNTDWVDTQTDLFTEEELSDLMNKMLLSFIRQTSCGLLSKYAIIYYCQQLQQKEDVAYQCCKLWRSINAYKDIRMESQMFYNFFNQVYGPEVLDFYFKLRKALVRYVHGDTADPTQAINSVYLPPDKLVAITEKLLISAYPIHGSKGYSERLSILIKSLLRITEADHLQRIKVIDFLCHCVMEYKAIGLSQAAPLVSENPANCLDLRWEGKSKKPFYGVNDMAKEWGDLAHHKEKVDHIKEQKIFESRSGSPIQIRGGALRYSNNPPPCREYFARPKISVIKNSVMNNSRSNEVSMMSSQQRSRTPIDPSSRERAVDPHFELQSRIKHLEDIIKSLKNENQEYVKTIQTLAEENRKLNDALEDSVKVCKEYADENEALREQLNENQRKEKNKLETPKAKPRPENNSSPNERSMSQLLQSVGKKSNRKKGGLSSNSKKQALNEAISLAKIKIEESPNESPPPLPPRNEEDDLGTLDDMGDMD